MTAILSRDDRRIALGTRLSELTEQRRQTMIELTPVGIGDDADRATNVDAHVRLAMLERRITDIEAELDDERRGPVAHAAGIAALGDVVSVDFGDGPEDYLLGSVEQAGPGMDVITPGSPLGRALVGASAGSDVEYAPRPHRSATVHLVSVA